MADEVPAEPAIPAVEGVRTRRDFVAFVEALRANLLWSLEYGENVAYGPVGVWENTTLDAYLDAMAAVVDDHADFPACGDCQLAAQVLRYAVGYE